MLTKNAKRAVEKYSEAKCRRAFYMNRYQGEGSSTIGIYLGLTTNQADAACIAGEQLFNADQRQIAELHAAF